MHQPIKRKNHEIPFQYGTMVDKDLDKLRAALDVIPNNKMLTVSLKVNKDTPTNEIEEIKNALRGFYTYRFTP